MPPWEGPFVIAEVLRPGTYKLANEAGEVFKNAWNIEQIRHFYPSNFVKISICSFPQKNNGNSNYMVVSF